MLLFASYAFFSASCPSFLLFCTPARMAKALLAHETCFLGPLTKSSPSKDFAWMASMSLALYSVAERGDPSPGAAKVGSGLPSVLASLMRALMQKMTMHWNAVDLSSSSFPAIC